MQRGNRTDGNGSKKHRRNWSFPDATVETINRIRESTDAGADVDVIKRALRIYEHVIMNQNDGGRLILRDKDGKDIPFIIL